MSNRIDGSLHCIGIRKRGETYAFVFDRLHLGEVLRTIGRFASDPELSLSWYDAAALSQHLRAMIGEED
jgi:hypothetical protein